MKYNTKLAGFLLSIVVVSGNYAQGDELTVLKGPYLGQKPPGMMPEIFVPGAVSSKDHIEMGCTWSPNLEEFYFARSETSELRSNWAIWCLREENGVWSEPQVVPFSGVYRDFGPFIPPDGNCMIFNRRDNKDNKTRMGSWIVDRKGSTWSEPRFFHEAYCLTTNDFRTFYFSTEGSERDIGRMEFDNGFFSTPVKVPSALNTPEFEAHACLSPDGSYMLFDRTKSTFVSFLRDDGTWSRGYDLDRKYNIPAISPDGKYIFFESDGDIYWVDAKIIEKFRIQGAQKDDFPALTGPYLGQKPPGLAPEVFAPGIVSTVHHEHSRIEFSQDGMEIYWAVIPVDKNSRTRMGRPFRMDLQSIRLLKNSSGGWSSPQALQIIKNKDARSPVLSPDEKFLYFFSSDPNVDPMMNSKSILYRASRKDGVWAEPVRVSGLIPQEVGKGTMSFCFAKNGNVYFDYGQADATGEYVWHIYFSEYQYGAYRAPLKLEYGINDGKSDWCPWIAPDESYLIWSSHREGEAGNGDLYISFRQATGTWGRPVNMGIEVNTSGQERFPSVSPDGKYLFFARHKDRITYSDIYWMSASVIETLREKVSSTEKEDRAGVAYSWSKPNDFPKLTGPYLGQKPPGKMPMVFAPGVVSKEGDQSRLFVSPDGSWDRIVGGGASETIREGSNEKAIITKIIHDSFAWALTKDRALFESLFAKDEDFFTYYPDSKSTVVGWAEFQKYLERWMDPRNKAIDFDIRNLRLVMAKTGDVAWFSAVVDDSGEWDGKPWGSKNVRWTGVLEKREGRWVIVQQHMSLAVDQALEPDGKQQ